VPVETCVPMGPLSWAQEAVIEKELTEGAYLPPVWKVFEIPAHITDNELTSRLRAVVDSQDVLRVTNVTAGDTGQVYCQQNIELPLKHLKCTDLAELREVVASHDRSFAGDDRAFIRDGRPLWELTVYHIGGERRFAYLAIDHLIADALSMQVIVEVLTGSLEPGTLRQSGSYWDWVNWQCREFPREDHRRIAPRRDFWLRHLDGTMPDRPAPMPFAVGGADARPGQVTTLTTDLPVSLGEVRAAAGRLRATPFLLVLAGLASWVARQTGCYDMTVRVLDSSRRRPYHHTVGWLADAFPMRICDRSADDVVRALDAGRRTLGQIMPTEALTPWHYLQRVCAPDKRGGSRGQLLISIPPGGRPNLLAGEPGERVSRGDIEELQVFLTQNARGTCRMVVALSNEDFSTAGGWKLLRSLAELLTRTVRTGRLAWQ
jgi:hypothetical protein